MENNIKDKVWKLEEIKKDPQQILPDIQKYIKLLEENESDGWNTETEGEIANVKDTNLTVQSKTFQNDPLIYLKATGIFKDIDVDKFIRMMDDIDLRKIWDERCKGGDAICFLTGEGKLFYLQMKFPFPLTDRDCVAKRFCVCNKYHPELIKKYGLPEKDHKYWFIVIEPIKLEEYPENKDFVRAEMTLVFFVEEVPDKPGFASLRGIMQNSIGGSIPNFVVNFIAGKVPSRLFAQIYESYNDLQKKGLLDKKEEKKEKLFLA